MKQFLLLLCSIGVLYCCKEPTSNSTQEKVSQQELEQSFQKRLETHLNAVENRDIEKLKATLSPEGTMKFIFPNMEMISTVDGFVENQTQFFADTLWTFETNIIHQNIGNTLGYAIVDAMYSEADRNGEPYFNNMLITYVLERENGQWYVIHDQPTTIKKSTD